jgi:hypothetical protein
MPTDCIGDQLCSPFDLTTDPANCFMQNSAAEAITIAGATMNVFRLLGIHQQGQLIDLTGNGTPISSGEYPDYKAVNVYNDNFDEWRSVQKGSFVTSAAFFGYDFGPILLDNGRLRYSVDTDVRHHITSIRIAQGCESNNRISRARIERSDDGNVWYGVAIINLKDTFDVETISFSQSAPSRFWRIRPLTFLGGTDDFWAIRQLELIDYTALHISNIQDELGFLENRDRAYAKESVGMRGFYEVQDYATSLSRFGIDLNDLQTFNIKVAFNVAVAMLGRPFVIGDIIELPSEAQYAPDMTVVKKYLEVNDVGWAADGFTPGWKPTIQRISAIPMLASQETLDIVGDINPATNLNDFFGLEHTPFNKDAFVAQAKIEAAAETWVPERGEDIADVRFFNDEEVKKAAAIGINIAKFNINQRGAYVEDGMPPNGISYTEGQTWPTSPVDGSYHRLTYEKRLNIPVRLHKYSVAKNRWVFVEEDKRSQYNTAKPMLNSLLQDPTRVHNNEIE